MDLSSIKVIEQPRKTRHYNKHYYQENREKKLIIQKLYYQENRSERLKYQKKYDEFLLKVREPYNSEIS